MATSTTGTGTITLGSAATGFTTFANAGVADGDVVAYSIEDGDNRETGYGVYTSSGTTLTRNVAYSTNSGAAINLSGSAEVMLCPLPSDILESNDNLLMNGDGQFNQREKTTGLADDEYFHCRHYALTQSNNITAAQLTDVADTYPFMHRLLQANASAQRFGAAQIIEGKNCRFLRGKKTTLSGVVRCSAATTIRWAILEWTGTEDSVTSDVVLDWTDSTFAAGNFFLSSNITVAGTGSAALSANTLTDFSLTAEISSSMNNVIIMIWTDSTQVQNVTLDWRWKYERGDIATSWQPRQLEKMLCQRYYFRDSVYGFSLNFAIYAANGWATVVYPYPVEMRATPSANEDFTGVVTSGTFATSPAFNAGSNVAGKITAQWTGAGINQTINFLSATNAYLEADAEL
jgi:hypothetical protein